jgi:hypothetical protein
MRRAFFLILGLLEFAVAGGLVALGWQAGTADVQQGFSRAEQVTRKAGTQVCLLRRQVHDLRRPELQELSERLGEQTRTATVALKTQQIDFDTVRALSDALGHVATGLDGLAATLNAGDFGKLGEGLGETAAFLEGIVPTASKAADDLDATAEGLRNDAARLHLLLQETPLDLKAARDIHDSLARFGEGLDRMRKTLRVDRLEAMRDGFQGMESALSTGAEQVEQLSSYSYPVVSIKGFRPEITQKPFWPEGETIAKGLRKAATGVSAADKELAELARELPRLRSSLDDSRRILDRTREALATALRQQDKLEPLLKDLPAKAADLAERLPQASSDLARLLRDTRRLKEVAAGLRRAQHGIDAVAIFWPELRRNLGRTAAVLKTTRSQLNEVLNNRQDYESARLQTVQLGDSFARLLPVFNEQLSSQLQEQDRALEDLGQSIEEVGDLLPVYGQTLQRILQAGRLLACLAALIVALHASYLILSVRIGRSYAI